MSHLASLQPPMANYSNYRHTYCRYDQLTMRAPRCCLDSLNVGSWNCRLSQWSWGLVIRRLLLVAVLSGMAVAPKVSVTGRLWQWPQGEGRGFTCVAFQHASQSRASSYCL
jgi:hypothetical protein